jgi:hypothetical protein
LVDNYSRGGFTIGLASFCDLVFSFLIVRWREMPIVEISTNNLVHIQLQPHLYKPPGAVDTRNLLAGVHQVSGLMEHIVNAS